MYSEVSVVLRAAVVIFLIASAAAAAAMTVKGRSAITFAQDSRMEVRKVVWPTRQETIQTTLIVLVVTVIMALILWGIDGIMVRLVRLFTGV
ncbi:Preprotein translocase subunit SecE [Candidatus Enterovibrio escicola]|uniref:Protein translocase subunit SecE n=1 Tax=Candidatus Enterovibrio escicola TaxID=1927127 RepID=A0A2A5T6X4_9GAMM|nr:Preprotein translocase subunit SecE [Candidatus Enterovibrio escacola]